MVGLTGILATTILWQGVMVYDCHQATCVPFPGHPTVQWVAHPAQWTIADCLATAITQMVHAARVDAQATAEALDESQGGPYLRTESQFQCLAAGETPSDVPRPQDHAQGGAR